MNEYWQNDNRKYQRRTNRNWMGANMWQIALLPVEVAHAITVLPGGGGHPRGNWVVLDTGEASRVDYETRVGHGGSGVSGGHGGAGISVALVFGPATMTMNICPPPPKNNKNNNNRGDFGTLEERALEGYLEERPLEGAWEEQALEKRTLEELTLEE